MQTTDQETDKGDQEIPVWLTSKTGTFIRGERASFTKWILCPDEQKIAQKVQGRQAEKDLWDLQWRYQRNKQTKNI